MNQLTVFITNICILCCFSTIVTSSAIPNDYEYRKRLEEYYKSIGESFPSQNSNEITTEQYAASNFNNNQESYNQNQQYIDNGSNNAQYDEIRQQNGYDKGDDVTNTDAELNAHDLYQQRLKEHYDNIKKMQELQQQTQMKDEHEELTTDIKAPVIIQNNIPEDDDYQKSLKDYYAAIGAKEIEEHFTEPLQTESPDSEYQRRLDEYYKQIQSGHDQIQEEHHPTTAIHHDAENERQEERVENYYKSPYPDQDTTTISTATEFHYDKNNRKYEQRPNEYYKKIKTDQGNTDINDYPATETRHGSDYDRDRQSLDYYYKQEANVDKPKTDHERYHTAENDIVDADTGIRHDKTRAKPSLNYVHCHPGNFRFTGAHEYTASTAFNLHLLCQSDAFYQRQQYAEKNFCHGLPTIDHGQINTEESYLLTGEEPNTYAIRSIVKFVCNYYATIADKSLQMQSECVPGGTWSQTQQCVAMPTCNLYTYLNHMQNPNNKLTTTYKNVTLLHSPLHEGNDHVIPGSIVQHRCQHGYTPDTNYGKMQVVCLNTGQWSPFPRCILTDKYKRGCITMPDSNLVRRNHLKIKAYQITQFAGQIIGNITYTCEDYYEPVNENAEFTVSCMNNVWTNLPVCKPQPMCSVDLGLPKCAQIINRQSYYLPGMRRQGYLPGSFVEYVCPQHHQMRHQFRHTNKVLCENMGTWKYIMNSS